MSREARLATSDSLRPGEVALGVELRAGAGEPLFHRTHLHPLGCPRRMPTAGRSRGALVPRRDRGALDACAFRHRSLRAPPASLLDAPRAARSRAAEPAARGPGAWHVRVALARPAEPDRLLDRGARARRGVEPLRARPRLRRRHPAHRHQAGALPARLTGSFRPSLARASLGPLILHPRGSSHKPSRRGIS